MKLRFSANAVCLVLYVALLAALAAALLQARSFTLANYDNNEAKASWNAWREAAKENSGGVKRRVTHSPEPPALVLMRDYFARCFALALVLASALFFTLAYFVRGILQNKRPPETPNSQPLP